ncbi:transporter family-2 protein [Litoreibacter meonggei]|uniref:Transporter family-2 protein n=1 Tax=Litoreibacter meonggei TaxID=1049199 RepID=A0A497X311_9RHOB|nr:transporter family-2 protein [Litoreibacter meonggei]
MSNTSYAIIMLAAGIGIPVLAALNASLGRTIGAPAAASVVLFAVAFLSALVVVLITGPAAIAKVATAPKHLLFAGVLIAFYVLTITYIAPHFGIGNAVFFVLLGQLISAALIDHFGLFGALQTPLTLTRATGIAVMAAGVFLTQITGRA